MARDEEEKLKEGSGEANQKLKYFKHRYFKWVEVDGIQKARCSTCGKTTGIAQRETSSMQKHMQQHSKELDELNKIEEKEKSAPKQMKQPKLFSIGAIVKVKIAVNPETQARY